MFVQYVCKSWFDAAWSSWCRDARNLRTDARGDVAEDDVVVALEHAVERRRVVDRALDPSHGQVVIAVYRDDFLCRRLCRRGEELGLQATDPDVPDVWASEGDAFDIWGVVTHVVKQVSN